MEFNRMISLVLGFIVLILLFVWIASRFRSTTKTTADNTVTITMTPTITPTKGASQGWNPLAFLNRSTPTPTPTKKVVVKKVTVTPTKTSTTGGGEGETTGTTTIVYKNNHTGQTTSYTVDGIKNIPSTGAETAAIPLALSALSLGVYLRKRS